MSLSQATTCDQCIIWLYLDALASDSQGRKIMTSRSYASNAQSPGFQTLYCNSQLPSLSSHFIPSLNVLGFHSSCGNPLLHSLSTSYSVNELRQFISFFFILHILLECLCITLHNSSSSLSKSTFSLLSC